MVVSRPPLDVARVAQPEESRPGPRTNRKKRAFFMGRKRGDLEHDAPVAQARYQSGFPADRRVTPFAASRTVHVAADRPARGGGFPEASRARGRSVRVARGLRSTWPRS